MKTFISLAAAATLATAGPAFAQPSQGQTTSQGQRIGDIFSAVFGDRFDSTTSLEAQWAAGRLPLAMQRVQLESRVDSEVRSGALTWAVGSRLKSDYLDLVELEARYAGDRLFTAQERRDLADRYAALTQVLTDGRYADNTSAAVAEVAEGRVEFESRVNAAVTARKLTRVQGSRLKAEYTALVPLEAGYLRDGVISESERQDLDERLDALDARLGDPNFASALTRPRDRLDAIARALPTSGLSTVAQAQLRVEHADLSRLEAAYSRLTVSADDRAYLDRRLTQLETRTRIRR